MKKRIFAIAVVICCLSVLASTTLAYWTDSDIARNVITSAGVDVKIVEEQLVDGVLQPYPGHPIQIMPATRVSKIVSVQNLQGDSWIRMNYTLAVYDAAGSEMDIPAGKLAEMILIAPNTADWTYKDSWWYYKDALKPWEKSAPLFEEVVFSGPHIDNKYQNCTVKINVTVHAVQQAHNGESVWAALGWPEN